MTQTRPNPPPTLPNGTPIFGWHAAIDVHECNVVALNDPVGIRAFVVSLIDDILGMRRYGPLHLEWFGTDSPDTEGFSFVQLIETSCVSGHLSPHLASGYIDVFSCRPYDLDRVVHHTLNAFGARSWRVRNLVR